MKAGEKGVSHLIAATRHSLSGLRFAVGEAAFRQELLLGLVHFAALAIVRPSALVCIGLTLVWVLVLTLELVNTALEAVVDLASPAYHDLAKKAKDVASAAVGVWLVTFFALWGIVLAL